MISVRNLKDVGGYRAQLLKPWQVRVDRSSVLGNPFPMASEADRVDVCVKYLEYFKDKVRSKDEAFCNELRRLIAIYRKYGVLELYCWCAPKKCHAETIKWFIERRVSK